MEELSRPREEVALAQIMGQLCGGNRRGRQDASHMIESIAKTSPKQLFAYVDDLMDALDRPEAQTRWEVLSALSEMAKVDAGRLAEAYEGAESSLFDEGSATVRLSAFRFLTSYGMGDPKRSDEVWPLLDEAVQCYHGDPEYHDMLVCLLDFARGNISEASAEALAARVSFDAENGRSYIKAFSTEIADAAKR
ncbi:hypothetical protein [Olsenella urininfantis]|uniref:hypothetical protein n=1 Tax=Olsenella urininfantis TaxID=1871033 RepID=UPI001F48B7D9|nr:hypothetical protein [Olsenella urininfantis]